MNIQTSWATSIRRALTTAAAGAALLAVPASAQTTFVVDSAADDAVTTSATPDGNLTLREAITAANTNAAFGDAPAGSATGDQITFDAGVGRIQLTLGQLEITDDLIVDGGSVTQVGPQLDMRSRIFDVTTTEDVTFLSITLRDGYILSESGGGVRVAAGGNVGFAQTTFQQCVGMSGGGLSVGSGATVTLGNGVAFNGNRAFGSAATNGGGAIYIAGDVSMDVFNSVSFISNRATVGSGSGGALFIADGGSFVVNAAPAGLTSAQGGGGATFSDNRAARAGGAVEVREGGLFDMTFGSFNANRTGPAPGNGGALHITGAGSATLNNTSVTNNVASSEGGGLWNSATGTLAVSGGTISGNLARGAAADNGGGGVFSDGGATSLSDVQITGNSANGAAGSGGGVFANATTTFTLDGVTLANNTAQRAGGGVEILAGSMAITGTTFQSNEVARSPGNGGALHISGAGSVTIDMSTVTGNRAGNEGGGLWNSGAGTMTVTETTIDGNVTLGNGGGVYQQAGSNGTTILSNVAITNNSASAFGGGLFAEGAAVAVNNSTLSGNAAARGGGGAAEDAVVSFMSSTIAANTASGRGGGFANPNMDKRVQLQNTLVGDNVSGSAAVELSGFYVSMGNNLVESRTGAGIAGQMATDLYGVDPMIGPLADNGGPTLTHALLAGSPAIDAGMTDFVTDQRGELREDPDDIGAFDFGAMMAGPGAMLISGIIDGPLTGGLPKGIELYVTEDIADLSRFGVSNVSNGGGSPGMVEFPFPAGSAAAGDFLYVASEVDGWTAWFGFAPDYNAGTIMNNNGDDAVELYLDGAIVDVFGDVNTDGTGQAWEYLDSWAYRVNGTGPDGSTFVVGNFTYAGPNVLDDDATATNATATPPFPVGTYTDAPPAQGQTAAKFGDEAVKTGLSPVAPNPIRQTGRVQFSVAQSETVTVELYDMMGRRVQQLYAGTPTAETVVDVTIDASALASGVYVVVMQSETQRETQRVTVAR